MILAKNSDYWKERFGQLEAAQNQKGVEAYLEIERIYKQAQREIEGEISKWYQRLATNNGISMAEARKLLSGSDLKEFKWDVKEYIRYGQENALTGAWMKELENASAKFHISRLEALKMHTQHSLEVMSAKQHGITSGAMAGILKSGYYHTAYELQKGFGIGWDIAGLDQGHIEKLLSKPWAADGKNFSERIWSNKQKLISEIHNELTRNIMLGKDPQKAIDAIAKKMNTSKNNAGRLVMTEEAYFSSAAQKECFNDLDVEKYEIVATLDSHTSDICQSLDGKVFAMKDFEPGVTAPPFHVYCRSTTVPYFEEDFDQSGERAARDAKTGKTYYVPDDMNYQEWKETFVDGGDKSGMDVYEQNGVNHWTKKANIDKIGSMNDITQEWTGAKETKGAVTERQEYTVEGTTYKVDGRHVILRPTEQEREVAAILSGKYGKHIEFVPQVMVPQGVQTPDYLVDGERFDLKSPTGRSKDLLYNVVSKKRKQASSFILDVTDCPLSEDEVIKQAEALYFSRHTRFVDKIVIMKNGEILKVYGRK